MSAHLLPLSPEAKGALPTHVAIIMDGNGRWAKQRHLPRVEGHRHGVESVRAVVRAAGEVLGIEPLVVANEGKAVLGVRPAAADRVLRALRDHPLGRDAAVVGTAISERPGQVVLDTGLGRRLLAEPEGEPLPRIC